MPLPSGLGSEAAGVIEEVGPGVSGLKAGDRVAYAGGPLGAYSEARVMPADRLVPVPAGITDQQAAAMMLKGMTAWYLIRRTHVVKPGETILIHAAAGGVGLIVCQWAKHLGATVIGTVGERREGGARQGQRLRPPDRLPQARISSRGSTRSPAARNCRWSTIRSARTPSTSRSTASRRLGLMALFGQSSGAVPPVDLGILAGKGSLFLTRPTLNTYTATREDLLTASGELFDVVQKGAVKIAINQTYPLRDAAQAHRDLQARKTTGSTVFTV